MSEYWRKNHNVTVDGPVDKILAEVCVEIEKRYQIKFLKIGADKDHVHFFSTITSNVQCH